MANLGSNDTPVEGERFALPAGAEIGEDAGDLVIRDSAGDVVLRRDESAGQWVIGTVDALDVTNALTAGSVSTDEASVTGAIDAASIDATNAVAAEQLGIPVYSDDANAPNDTFFYNDQDDQTKYKNPAGSIVVTDALSQSEVEDIAIKFAVAL